MQADNILYDIIYLCEKKCTYTAIAISIQALENRFHPVRAIYIHIMNSIRFFNVPKSFHSYGASPSPIGVYRERRIGYTRS